MRKKSRWISVFGLVLAAAAVAGGQTQVQAEDNRTTTIADGVCIGSVDVGGMTKSEALETIAAYVDSLNTTTFTLSGANGSIEVTAADMGLTTDAEASVDEALTVAQSGSLLKRFTDTKDLENGEIVMDLKLEVDKQMTAQLLYDNRSTLNVEAVDMGLTRENGSFQIVEGQAGSEVDYVQSVYEINEFLAAEWDGTDNGIELVSIESQPKGSAEELAKVTDVLGTFSTDFSSSTAGRAQNVKNGCERINGTVVYPGEEFSVYSTVSPFTAENGYELAGAYANGTTVESFGGGICQVSTTLYNAVLRAELDVTKRYNHSMVVSYVDPSVDAAIAGTYKDFRFVNDSETPIYIEGVCSGGIITFRIYGQETRDSKRVVTFESEVTETTEPDIEFQLMADQPVGYYSRVQSSHTGYKARLWKIVTVDGNLESREQINSSTYNMSPRIVAVGTAGATPEQIAQIQAAIANAVATKDESGVRSTVDAIAAANATGVVEEPVVPLPTEPTTPEETTPEPDATIPEDGVTDNVVQDATGESIQ